MANKYDVRLTEDNGDVNIYTDVTSINIDDKKIEVEFEGKRANHWMTEMDEIVIKTNR